MIDTFSFVWSLSGLSSRSLLSDFRFALLHIRRSFTFLCTDLLNNTSTPLIAFHNYTLLYNTVRYLWLLNGQKVQLYFDFLKKPTRGIH